MGKLRSTLSRDVDESADSLQGCTLPKPVPPLTTALLRPHTLVVPWVPPAQPLPATLASSASLPVAQHTAHGATDDEAGVARKQEGLGG